MSAITIQINYKINKKCFVKPPDSLFEQVIQTLYSVIKKSLTARFFPCYRLHPRRTATLPSGCSDGPIVMRERACVDAADNCLNAGAGWMPDKAAIPWRLKRFLEIE
ncbi:TPA: hypothetical protein QDB28_005950 [Burkholderia vietnamiensis]|nr:hypothetical protein [Burkholderia vietnamiensis]